MTTQTKSGRDAEPGISFRVSALIGDDNTASDRRNDDTKSQRRGRTTSKIASKIGHAVDIKVEPRENSENEKQGDVWPQGRLARSGGSDGRHEGVVRHGSKLKGLSFVSRSSSDSVRSLAHASPENQMSPRRNKRKSFDPRKRQDCVPEKKIRLDGDVTFEQTTFDEQSLASHSTLCLSQSSFSSPSETDSDCSGRSSEGSVSVPPDVIRIPTVPKSRLITHDDVTTCRTSCSHSTSIAALPCGRTLSHSSSDNRGRKQKCQTQTTCRVSGSMPQQDDDDEDNQLNMAHKSPDTILHEAFQNKVEGVHDYHKSRPKQRNYKNMSRDRRVEANARERSRVHTISAAFEALRRAVPSFSYNQKLSKLAILRIASCYIMALSKLADTGDNDDSLSFGDCVDMCTKTIQMEGKPRRRKVQTKKKRKKRLNCENDSEFRKI